MIVGANCYSPLFFAKFPSLGRMAIRPYLACRVRCGILTRVDTKRFQPEFRITMIPNQIFFVI